MAMPLRHTSEPRRAWHELPMVGVAGRIVHKWMPSFRNLGALEPPIFTERWAERSSQFWDHAIWFPSWDYVIGKKRGNSRELVWKAGMMEIYHPDYRQMDVIPDCGSYQLWQYEQAMKHPDPGKRPKRKPPSWMADEELYLEACIEYLKAPAFMMQDVIGNQLETTRRYRRLVQRGYGGRAIPVLHVTSFWDASRDSRFPRRQQTVAGTEFQPVSEEMIRCARANAIAVTRSEDLRYMAEHSPVIGLGALAKVPIRTIPMAMRAAFLEELVYQTKGTVKFWVLGGANSTLFNMLSRLGVQDYVSADGFHWFKQVQHEQMILYNNETKLLEMANLKAFGYSASITTFQAAVGNLCALLSAKAQAESWPAPGVTPEMLRDPVVMAQLLERIEKEQKTFETIFRLGQRERARLLQEGALWAPKGQAGGCEAGKGTGEDVDDE